GLQDILQCLNGALSKLECTGPQVELDAENAIKVVLGIQGSAGFQATVLMMLLCFLLLQAFGGHFVSNMAKPACTKSKEAGFIQLQASPRHRKPMVFLRL
ncbi:MAG: hypothetical protein ACRCVN_01230, partial [Spirochaetia bacterium]